MDRVLGKMVRSERYRWFAWGFLAYTVAVILWGAFVRATGSGAGCGDHWPLCNGQVVPRAPAVETLVELTHRITSGFAWLLALVGWVWARRLFERGAPVRRGAGWTLFFMTTEALVGAGLVLFQMVADNASAARGAWMAAHLLNTFLLLGAMTLTAWWASGGARLRLRGQGPAVLWLAASLLGTLVLGMSGAITALGDTLFPGTSTAEALSPGAHVFLQLRIFHPIIGLAVGLLVCITASHLAANRSDPRVRLAAWSVVGIYAFQVGLGFLNVALKAPVWMQLVHLLVADLVWIGLLLLGATALAHPSTEAGRSRDAHRPAELAA